MYQEALGIELQLRGIPFVKQSLVAVKHKGRYVGRGRLDLLVNDTLLVELKAVENLLSIHEAQVFSYLKMTDRQLGLLINFKVPILKNGIRRIILS